MSSMKIICIFDSRFLTKRIYILQNELTDILFFRSVLLNCWVSLIRLVSNLIRRFEFHYKPFFQFIQSLFNKNNKKIINHLDFGVLLE
jgi:hypothetical protein